MTHAVRLVALIIPISSFMLLAIGCSYEKSTSEQILNRSIAGEFETLDPQKASTNQSKRILVDLFEGLLRFGPGGTIENGLAESWSVTDDGLEYTFNIRKDALWSNGDRISAKDFVYSFRRLVTPSVGAFYSSFVTPIENAQDILSGKLDPSELAVSSPSELTLKIRLSAPTPYFPQLLTHPSTSPLHEETITQHGTKWTRPDNIVSNGAFVLAEQVLGSHVILTKNIFHRESDEIAIEKVRYFVIVSDEAAYVRYRAGELHVISTVPSEALPKIRRERPSELHISPLFGVYYYGFNLRNDLFRNKPKLRAALSMSIDREMIVNAVTKRGEVPAYSWVPPGLEHYQRPQYEWSDWSRTERIERARTLYREAGFSDENPVQIELRYNTGANEERIALAIQSMWKLTLGAKVSLHNEEFKVLYDNILQGEITEMFRLSWIGDYFDPNAFLEVLHSQNPQNLVGYSEVEVDTLISQASMELDSGQRMEILAEAEKIAMDDYPLIPIYFYVAKYLVKPEVQGWQPNSADIYPTRLLQLAE